MAGVAVVTDSTSSLDLATAARAGITVIPLQVVIDGTSQPEDEVGPGVVAAALRRGLSVSTSRPSPDAFAVAYAALAEQGFDAIVSVHLSAKISGTCAAAEVAGVSAGIPVTVVDSHTAGMALGFAALRGAELAGTGASAADVVVAVRERAEASTTYFSVDNLEYLRRSGRLGPAAALIGSALAVKPLLQVGEGTIQPYERVRTSARALLRLEELGLAALAAAAEGGVEVDVAVHHLDNVVVAEHLAAQLGRRIPRGREVVVAELSAVLGGHVGPRTFGVVISPRV